MQALSEREREALRLLLKGHDAKSIARSLGLSVHTVNERLRDARRKLEVSSSREAARLLDESEQGIPNSLGDKQIGVSGSEMNVPLNGKPVRRHVAGAPLAWLLGGTLVMSLLIAAVLLSPGFIEKSGARSTTEALMRDPLTLSTARLEAALQRYCEPLLAGSTPAQTEEKLAADGFVRATLGREPAWRKDDLLLALSDAPPSVCAIEIPLPPKTTHDQAMSILDGWAKSHPGAERFDGPRGFTWTVPSLNAHLMMTSRPRSSGQISLIFMLGTYDQTRADKSEAR